MPRNDGKMARVLCDYINNLTKILTTKLHAVEPLYRDKLSMPISKKGMLDIQLEYKLTDKNIASQFQVKYLHPLTYYKKQIFILLI